MELVFNAIDYQMYHIEKLLTKSEIMMITIVQ